MFSLNDRELSKLKSVVREKLLGYQFRFTTLRAKYERGGSGIMLDFVGVTHPHFKNVHILAFGTIKDTTLITSISLDLRFLHGRVKSPTVGIKITTIKIVIS